MINLELIVKVSYKPNGVSEEELREKLSNIIKDAMSNGHFTGDSPAEIDAIWYVVKTPENPNQWMESI